MSSTTITSSSNPSRSLAKEHLRLTAWERFMLVDDLPNFPMTCHIRFWFAGVLDRPAFAAAAAHSLARHPSLAAALDTSRQVPEWILHHDDLKPNILEVAPDAGTDRRRFSRPNLGIEFRIIHQPNGCQINVRFHHSVCDGIGIFAAMEDLLTDYRLRTSPDAPITQSPTPDNFDLRDPLKWARQRGVRGLLNDLSRIIPFILRLPSVLGIGDRHERHASSMSDTCSVERRILTAEQTRGLASRARASGATINDLLVSEMFATLGSDSHKDLRTGGNTIRVAVPISMRDERHQNMMAANCVSMVFLDRSIQQSQKDRGLLKGIAAELDGVKKSGTGHAMHRALSWMLAIPGAIELMLKAPWRQSTIVLTNLGRPFATSHLRDAGNSAGKLSAGGLTLESLDTIPPLRRGTAIALSVNGYGGCMSLSLHHDERFVSAAAAARVLDAYVEKILSARD